MNLEVRRILTCLLYKNDGDRFLIYWRVTIYSNEIEILKNPYLILVVFSYFGHWDVNQGK